MKLNSLFAAAGIFLFVFAGETNAQTFYGGGGAIPDNSPPVYFPLNVSGLIPDTIDAQHGLKRVCIKITHPYTTDLNIYLQSPDGSVIVLSTGNGGSGDDHDSTFFTTDPSSDLIEQHGAPFNGSYWPEGYLGAANNGQSGNGIWNLIVQDAAAQDVGDLLWWQLEFGNSVTPPIQISATPLPILSINTLGAFIPNEPKINGHMGIIYNGAGQLNHSTDSFNNYDGNIQIERRGSSSQFFAQVSYGIKTTDALDSALNVSLLDMPSEHHWILYAPYNDKSLMRNALIYQISREMGNWAPRCRFVEVFINNQYEGIYVLMEKIKQDDNRVDIAKLTPSDISGDELTGGYILKIDKWSGSNNQGWESDFRACDDTSAQTGHIYFQYDDPKGPELESQQKIYIRSFIDSFETALKGPDFMSSTSGYRQFIDVQSFIDFSLCNEISRNIDGYRLSSYLYKDRNSNGGLIHCGPIWDFNLSFGNANYYSGAYWDDWEWNFPCPFGDGGQNPFWWKRFLQDSTYEKQLKCRYSFLRQSVFSNQHINSLIDSFAFIVNPAQQRHFDRYPILGKYCWPNDWLPPTFAQEVDTLRSWFMARMNWIDQSLLIDSCDYNNSAYSQLNLNGETVSRLYPNPVQRAQNINLDLELLHPRLVHIDITDITGRSVYSIIRNGSKGINHLVWSLDIPPGIYLIQVDRELNKPPQKLIVVE